MRDEPSPPFVTGEKRAVEREGSERGRGGRAVDADYRRGRRGKRMERG